MVDSFIEAGRLRIVRPRLGTLNDGEPNRFRCVNSRLLLQHALPAPMSRDQRCISCSVLYGRSSGGQDLAGLGTYSHARTFPFKHRDFILKPRMPLSRRPK
jgi:hypothetical protein